jgi:hypothetical protein
VLVDVVEDCGMPFECAIVCVFADISGAAPCCVCACVCALVNAKFSFGMVGVGVCADNGGEGVSACMCAACCCAYVLSGRCAYVFAGNSICRGSVGMSCACVCTLFV